MGGVEKDKTLFHFLGISRKNSFSFLPPEIPKGWNYRSDRKLLDFTFYFLTGNRGGDTPPRSLVRHMMTTTLSSLPLSLSLPPFAATDIQTHTWFLLPSTTFAK